MRVQILLIIPFFIVACQGDKGEGKPFEYRLEGTRVSNLIQESFHKKVGDSSPSLVWDQTSFQFDTVFSGDRVQAPFTARNASDVPIIIMDIENTCGCTSSVVGQEVLQPGASTTLLIQFNTEGWKGLQYKKIRVWTNTMPSLQVLELIGFVE